MNDQSGTQFRFKPRSLRRHDLATVGNIHDLLHRHRIEGKCRTHLSAVDTTLQFTQSAKTTYEVDALGGTEVADIQYLVENQTTADIHVEHTDGVGIVVSTLLRFQTIPVLVEIEGELMQLLGLIDLRTLILNNEVNLQSGKGTPQTTYR